jgi:branched-chain amino acid transport system ATP-binding protein
VNGLAVRDLEVRRAGFPVVHACTLAAPPGDVTVLLGANGAGKTTLVEAVSGIVPAARGHVALDGREITRLARRRRARLGLAHVEQGRTVFGELTVRENLRVASRDGDIGHPLELFPELRARLDVPAAHLSGGEQQMLVLGRALAARPRALLLDELSLGLAPRVVHRLMPVIREIADAGAAVLLVEQFAALALSIGDRAYVLRRGRIALERPCRELVGARDVLRAAYLGAAPSAVG